MRQQKINDEIKRYLSDDDYEKLMKFSSNMFSMYYGKQLLFIKDSGDNPNILKLKELLVKKYAEMASFYNSDFVHNPHDLKRMEGCLINIGVFDRINDHGIKYYICTPTTIINLKNREPYAADNMPSLIFFTNERISKSLKNRSVLINVKTPRRMAIINFLKRKDK